MKIIMSGYYGFSNLGDEAILKSIVRALKGVDSDIDITVLSNNIKHTESNYNVRAINRWNPINIFFEIKKSDGLISGGGSLFQDITSSRTVFYYGLIIALAKLAGKPVFIYAQGIGPINKNINKKIIRFLFNRVNYITLRDDDSKNLIKSIGVNKNIEVVPDPVMAFDIDNVDTYLSNEYKNKTYITVSIRDWKSSNSMFLDNIAKACDKIVANGIDVVFIPMHGKDDENISNIVLQKMKYKGEVISSSLSIEQRVAYIKHSKILIGMRLHALVFAATAGVPMIGISYDPKIDSYLNMIEQASIGRVEDFSDPSQLVNLVLDIVKDYESSKNKIECKSDELRKIANLTAKLAIENIRLNI